MPTLTKNKKIALGLCSIFLVLGLVFVAFASDAKAGTLVELTGVTILKILNWVAYAFLKITSLFVSVAAFLLEASFKIEDQGFTKATIVTSGWEITRGLCNMFFALILLLVSFDTILQINKFQAKVILPRLLLVALTINFSLMFLGIIIDFSQILTRYFIEAAGGSTGSISEQLANGLNIARAFETNKVLVEPDIVQKSLGGGISSQLMLLGTQLFGIVIILIASFSLAAGAIFMLIRLVSLWILLIFSPLAWLGMIAPIPGLSSITGDWWSKFLKWTFFAPIYAFFIYLAVLAAGTPVFDNVQLASQRLTTSGLFVSGFFDAKTGIATLLQYVVVIALLLMGIQTAQSSGLAGAGAVVGWGKKMGDKMKGFTTNLAKRPGQWAYDTGTSALAKGAGDVLSHIPLLKATGRRLKAKGVGMETQAENREQNKAYANNLKTMADADLQEEVKHAFGIKKLLAARQAKERGLLEKTEDPEVVKKAMETFGTYGVKDEDGKTKEQRDLEDVRFDALGLDYDSPEGKAQLEKIITRSKENGNLEKIKPVLAGDSNAMKAIVGTLGHEFNDTYKKWGKKTKEAAKGAIFNSFTEKGNSNNEDKMRIAFATVTGDIGKAFGQVKEETNSEGKKIAITVTHEEKRPDGTLTTRPVIADTQGLKDYIGTLTAAKAAEIRGTKEQLWSNLQLVGQYASAKLVNDLGKERNASSEQKDAFAAGVKAGTDEAAKKMIDENPGWGGATAKEAKTRKEKIKNRPTQPSN